MKSACGGITVRWTLGLEWVLVITIIISTEVMARWSLGPEWVRVIAIYEKCLRWYHGKVDTRPAVGSSYYREPLLKTPCADVHDSLFYFSLGYGLSLLPFFFFFFIDHDASIISFSLSFAWT